MKKIAKPGLGQGFSVERKLKPSRLPRKLGERAGDSWVLNGEGIRGTI